MFKPPISHGINNLSKNRGSCSWMDWNWSLPALDSIHSVGQQNIPSRCWGEHVQMSMALTSMQGSLEAAVQVVDQSNQEVETDADKAQDAPRKWEIHFWAVTKTLVIFFFRGWTTSQDPVFGDFFLYPVCKDPYLTSIVRFLNTAQVRLVGLSVFFVGSGGCWEEDAIGVDGMVENATWIQMFLPDLLWNFWVVSPKTGPR